MILFIRVLKQRCAWCSHASGMADRGEVSLRRYPKRGSGSECLRWLHCLMTSSLALKMKKTLLTNGINELFSFVLLQFKLKTAFRKFEVASFCSEHERSI